MDVSIESSWKLQLQKEFEQPYFDSLIHFVKNEYANSPGDIFPIGTNIFNAYDTCPFDKVKVVIIGQDPYHSFELNEGKKVPHAHGLCFSIPEEAKKVPPSLRNIYKEIQSDLGAENYSIPSGGNLQNWANQGVLMLNATLTVRNGQAGSHQGKGWEKFTDATIRQLSKERTGIVFLLWGRFAQNKGSMIDGSKHLILTAAHPSPFSAYNGFFGCKHFSKANAYLKAQGQSTIDW